MFGDVVDDPNLLNAADWKTRSLRFGGPPPSNTHLRVAVALALRFHYRLGELVLTICDSASEREQVAIPSFDVLSNLSHLPDTSPPHHASALALTRGDAPATKAVGAALKVPAVLTFVEDPGRCGVSLSICFCDSVITVTQAGWFTIHVARVLHYIQHSGEWTALPDPQSGYLQAYLFESTTEGPARYAIYTPPFVPPSSYAVHLCVADCARYDPLAPALSLQTDDRQTTVNYSSLYGAAILVAKVMQECNILHDIILPQSLNPISLAIGMLATSLRGLILVASGSSHESLPWTPNPLPEEVVATLARYSADPDAVLYASGWECQLDISRLDYDASSLFPMTFPADAPGRKTIWKSVLNDLVTRHLAGKTRWGDFIAGNEGSQPTVLFQATPLSRTWIFFLWETLMHRGVAQFRPTASITTPDLLERCQCTHVVLHRENVDGLMRLVGASSSLESTTGVMNGGPCLSVILTEDDISAEEAARLEEKHLRVILMAKDLRALPFDPVIIYRREGCTLTIEDVRRQINASKSITPKGAAVIPLENGLIAKLGRGVRTTEMENALFVRRNTTIPVPDIHLMIYFGRMNHCIVMDHILGRCLDAHWVTLTDEERELVLVQLEGYLSQLHSIPSPPGQRPGPVDGSYLIGRYFPEDGILPFKTNADLVSWQNSVLKKIITPLKLARNPGEFVERPLVFTHQDLSPRNLILDNDGKLWMIDWDRAGWYPDYFEDASIQLEPYFWRDATRPLFPISRAHYRFIRLMSLIRSAMDA